VAPEAEERTASAYRFRTTVDDGDTETLTVEQERTLTERYQLVNANRDRLLSYARTGALPGDVRDALQEAADRQQALSQTETELQRADQQLQRYRDAQSRIRENMKAVEADTDYHQRLLDKLKTQEDEIDALMDRVASLESTKAEQQDRLNNYLQDLDVE
jgi:DNA repair exonuclease SbcCD ATPase subunit